MVPTHALTHGHAVEGEDTAAVPTVVEVAIFCYLSHLQNDRPHGAFAVPTGEVFEAVEVAHQRKKERLGDFLVLSFWCRAKQREGELRRFAILDSEPP